MAASKGEQAMNPEYEAHERLCKSIGDMAKENEDLKQYVTGLENRLRALWDKLEGERKFYDQRIRELEIAGNAMYAFINPPSPCMRTSRMDNLLQGWDDAKININ
jgi:hypothetical protein